MKKTTKTLYLLLLLGTQSLVAQTFTKVKDIKPDTANDSEMGGFTVFENRIYFAANDSSANTEPWVSDGTSAGTTMLENLVPFSSYPGEFTEASGTLYFTAIGDDGQKIYKTTGDFQVDSVSNTAGFQFALTEMGGNIYFSNDLVGANLGYELYSVDTLTNTAFLIKDINTGIASSTHELFSLDGNKKAIVAANKLYFMANDGVHGHDMWVTDGTSVGTKLVKDIDTSSAASDNFTISSLYSIGNYVLFTVNGGELWSINTANDSTEKLFSQINNIRPAIQNGFIFLVDSNNHFYKTDGTLLGTSLVSGTVAPNNWYVFNNLLMADVFTQDLVIINTSTSTITPIQDINTNQFGSAGIIHFTEVNNKLYFLANDALISDYQLWETDGITATKMLNPAATRTNPYDYIETKPFAYNGELYFKAKFDGDGSALWKYTPAVTTGILDEKATAKTSIYPNPATDFIGLSAIYKTESYAIYNVLGKEVLKGNVSENQKIDIGQLATGMYVLKLNNSTTKTFIKN